MERGFTVSVERLRKGRTGSCVRAILLCVLTAGVAACGGGGSSSGGPVYPAPFASGEGRLISAQSVMAYSTASPDVVGAESPPGLDSFYSQLICNGLNQQDCASNVANLDTPQFGNFDLSRDPIGNNPLGIGI